MGDNFLAGWNITIIDGDGHLLISTLTNKIVNEHKPIFIGNNVWMAANSTILKGVSIFDEVIIPYGSIINKTCSHKCVIWGGMPNKILRNDILRIK